MKPGAPRTLLWPLVAAALVRLTCLPLGGHIAPSGDAAGYIQIAREFRETGHFSDIWAGVRPPLFRMLLAPGFDGSDRAGDHFPGLYLIQIAVDLLALALLVKLTRLRFGERAGAAAGWLYALYPPAILYASGVIMAESVTVLAVAGALLALHHLDRGLDQPGARVAPRVALLGLVLGLGILTKELLVPVTAVITLALFLRPGLPLARRFGLALATAGLALAVTIPWAAFNHQRHGVWIISGTFGDTSSAVDNVPPGETSMRFWKRLFLLELPQKLEASHDIFRRALVEYPGLTAERALIRLRIAAGPEDMLPIWIGMTFDGYQADPSSNFAMSRDAWRLPAGTWGRAVQLLCGAATVLLFALGAAGLVATGRGTLVRTTLLATAVVLVTLALTVASARYRQTLVPFFVPFAGLAVALLTDRGARREAQQHGTRRAAVCGLVVAVLLTVTIFLLPAP